MSRENQLSKKAYLVEMLKHKPKTNALEIARMLKISRRTFFRYLDDLRDSGAIITYHKTSASYSINGEYCFISQYLNMVISPVLID